MADGHKVVILSAKSREEFDAIQSDIIGDLRVQLVSVVSGERRRWGGDPSRAAQRILRGRLEAYLDHGATHYLVRNGAWQVDSRYSTGIRLDDLEHVRDIIRRSGAEGSESLSDVFGDTIRGERVVTKLQFRP